MDFHNRGGENEPYSEYIKWNVPIYGQFKQLTDLVYRTQNLRFGLKHF